MRGVSVCGKEGGGGETEKAGKKKSTGGRNPTQECKLVTMDDRGRKNLRTWLQKSLANHPENDNGLVAYVEAIVGDAEGTVRFFLISP